MENLPFGVMPSVVGKKKEKSSPPSPLLPFTTSTLCKSRCFLPAASDVQSRSLHLGKENDENGFDLPYTNVGKSPKEPCPGRKVLAEENRVPTPGFFREARVEKNPPRRTGGREDVPPPSRDDECDRLDHRRYDPVANCCSLRPRFLRFNPNRRKEILLRSEMDLKMESMAPISSGTSGGPLTELDFGVFDYGEVPEDCDASEKKESGTFLRDLVRRSLLLLGLLFLSSCYMSAVDSSQTITPFGELQCPKGNDLISGYLFAYQIQGNFGKCLLFDGQMSLGLSFLNVVEGEVGSSSDVTSKGNCPIGASEMEPTAQIKVEDAADRNISDLLEGIVDIEMSVNFGDSENRRDLDAASERVDEISKSGGCETKEENPQSSDELGAENFDPEFGVENDMDVISGSEIGEEDFEGRLVNGRIVDEGTRFDSDGSGSEVLLKNHRNTMEHVELEQIESEQDAEVGNLSSCVDEMSNENSLPHRLVSTLPWCSDIAKYLEAYLINGGGYKSWVSPILGIAAVIALGTFMFGILGFLHSNNKRSIAQKSLRPSPPTTCLEKRSPSSHVKQISEKHDAGNLSCPLKVELLGEFSIVEEDQRKIAMKGTSQMEGVGESGSRGTSMDAEKKSRRKGRCLDQGQESSVSTTTPLRRSSRIRKPTGHS